MSSRTKLSCCGYCGKSMLDNSLALHCKEVHKKPKLVKGQTTLSFACGSKDKNTSQTNDVSESNSSSLKHPPEKRSREGEEEVTDNLSGCSSVPVPSKVEDKLDLILNKLSNLDLKISQSTSSSESEKSTGPIDPSNEQNTSTTHVDGKLRQC